LARAVPPEQAGLPASELVLVEELEVEEPRDGRLAVRKQDRVAELTRLIGAAVSPRCHRRKRMAVVLPAAVEPSLVARREGLIAVLDVPDRHAAVSRQRLARVF